MAVIVIASLGAYLLRSEEQYVPPTTVSDVSPTSISAPLDSRIIVTFNRPMNQGSVEGAFSISPTTNGAFAWDETTLIFTPLDGLVEGTTYAVMIGDSAVDAEGRHLDCGMFSWSFVTEGGSVARREVGTGPEDFWEAYPSTHPLSGTSVEHPEWVLDALEDGPVMILVHSEGCSPCVTQTAICAEISATYSGDITYFDLLSGTNEPEASEGFSVYDPTGGVHYIPLVIVVTKALDPVDGSAIVAWHSWEGVVYEAILTSWIVDSISHWEESV